MGRANVCVRSGRYYYECKVLKGVEYRSKEEALAAGRHSGPAVRIGWARRETSLEVVVGSDAYSYALRDVKGEKVHMSRPKPYFPPGEEVQIGDVVGVEICLPSDSFHRRVVDGSYNPAVDLEDDESNRTIEAAPIIRDRIPIRYKGQLYFEHMEYPASKELHDFVINPTPQTSSAGSGITGPAKLDLNPTNILPALRTLPYSYIKYYKNGKDMGKAFTELLAFLPPASNFPNQGARSGLDDGMLGYYPAVSVLRGSVAQINLGPDFWYPPPGYEDHDDEVDMVGSDQLPVIKTDKVRAVSERLSEQVAEDILYDIIDEVCNLVDDLARNGEGAPKAFQGLAMDEEIKELIQEED
jgi:COMPASS component BRE2